MGASVYLERVPPIRIEEWVQCISRSDTLRLNTEGYFARNPQTNEQIRIATLEGDTDILVNGDWRPGFLWCDGRPRIGIPPNEDEAQVVQSLASDLAQQLKAEVTVF